MGDDDAKVVQDQWARLREPFPPNMVGKLPKPTQRNAQKGRCDECGGWHGLPAVHLDYVGHAAVTARLLEVDPTWLWEPDLDEHGRWDVRIDGGEATLTGRLTVLGVTRPCVGTVEASKNDLLKQLQSDAIRNGAMRFGVALDLWSKEDLHGAPDDGARRPEPQRSEAVWQRQPDVREFSKAGAMNYLVDVMKHEAGITDLATCKAVWEAALSEQPTPIPAFDVHLAVDQWKEQA